MQRGSRKSGIRGWSLLFAPHAMLRVVLAAQNLFLLTEGECPPARERRQHRSISISGCCSTLLIYRQNVPGFEASTSIMLAPGLAVLQSEPSLAIY